MKKRLLSLALASMMILGALFGCTPAEPAPPASPADPGSSESYVPVTPAPPPEGLTANIVDDTLIFGASSDMSNLDPVAFTDLATQLAVESIYSKLFMFDVDLNVVPDLAEDWSNPEPTEWIIKIREGVKFHDGTEVTSEDVKASLDRARETTLIQHIVAQIDNIEIVDKYTVKLITKVPFAPLLNNLSDPCCSIIPKALIESGNDFNENPVGSGPFTLADRKLGDVTTLERFDGYFNAERASQLKTVKIRVIPEGSSRTIALETGEVQIINTVPTMDYDRILADEKLRIFEVPSNDIVYFAMNIEKAPFDNKLVRQAMQYAIDKESILAAAYNGHGSLLQSVSPQSVLGYKPHADYTYDPVKAKALLDEAGFNQAGQKIVISCYSDITNAAAQVIQANLLDIGIEAEIEQNVIATHLENCGKGLFQIALSAWSTAPDPDRFFRPLLHGNSINANNLTRFNNAEVNKLIDDGVGIMDPAERAANYNKVHDIVMEEAVMVPINSRMTAIAYDAGLQNVQVTPVSNLYFNIIRY